MYKLIYVYYNMSLLCLKVDSTQEDIGADDQATLFIRYVHYGEIKERFD